jgi:RNA polymerase sigma-70 factor, ECF subfamily
VTVAESKRMPQDAELVAGIGRGDETAMTQLYDRYSGIVYAVALRVVNDSSAAEDVLQEVFLQLWRNPGKFDANRGSLGAWLAVITRNRCIDLIRKRRPASDFADVVVALDCNLEDETSRKQIVERLRGAMSGMPAEQRAALEMAFFQGLTHTEIAEKTGQPLGTVKTRIRSGLLALRKSVGR